MKEEILKEMRESENRVVLLKKEIEANFEAKLDFILKNNVDTKQRIDSLQDFNAMVKVKFLDNITDLSAFKTNTSEDLFSQNIKVNNIQSELTKIVNKFDKMYTENLHIPGKLGENCTFRNLKDYIEVIITYT